LKSTESQAKTKNVRSFEEKIPKISLEIMRAVYDVLAQNSIGGKCKMSVREIGERAGVSPATANRAIRRMHADRIITIVPAKYVNEPDTIILEPNGFSVSVLQIKEKISNIVNDLEELSAMLPSLAAFPGEEADKAKRYEQIIGAIATATEFQNSLYVMLDPNKLDDNLKTEILARGYSEIVTNKN
jgi:DNA-binding transcriptional regulator YhcF (GntR family)